MIDYKKSIEVKKSTLYFNKTFLQKTYDTSQAKVILNVLDVNDVKPEFTKKIYQAQISRKAAIEWPLLRVRANDPDMGENGTLSYFVLGDAPFHVDADTGLFDLIVLEL